MADRPHLASGAIGQFGGRVGHKAAGFISKKFFHPSNYKNQELLWQAIEAKKQEEKRQEELQKKREEERRVEDLMKEMKSSSGVSTSLPAGSGSRFSGGSLVANDGLSHEERESKAETKRRLEMLKRAESISPVKLSVKSRYPEDVHEHGHTEVWGSFFDMSSKGWGYNCCHVLERGARCPNAPTSPKRHK